jgi:hypothetical protein
MPKYGLMNPKAISEAFGRVKWSRNKVERYKTDIR